MSPHHDVFDSTHWRSVFPLERLRRDVVEYAERMRRENPAWFRDQAAFDSYVSLNRPSAPHIDGPKSMVVCEQLRDEHGRARLGRGVPTDAFVMALGTPTHPALTRFGGVPYRPAGSAWPTNEDGEPMTFIAQLCFCDSRDLLPGVELPGDVLLLFGDSERFLEADSDPGVYHTEWHPLGLRSLATAGDVPPSEWRITPVYGVRHRTADYRVREDDEEGEELGVLPATKIGGFPRPIQQPVAAEGVFLAQIGSMNPSGMEFPLLNVPVSPWGEYAHDEHFLMFGDMGQVYLFLRSDGTVQVSADCA